MGRACARVDDQEVDYVVCVGQPAAVPVDHGHAVRLALLAQVCPGLRDAGRVPLEALDQVAPVDPETGRQPAALAPDVDDKAAGDARSAYEIRGPFPAGKRRRKRDGA